MTVNKILVTNSSFAKYNIKAQEFLENHGYSIVRPRQPVNNEDDLLCYLDDVVAIITGLEPITRKIINSVPGLKVIAKHGMGVDNIDLSAAKEKGVIVVNSPGTNKDAVADLVFGLILTLARKILKSDRQVRAGDWPKVFGHSVWGKTMGIIGMGGIGKSVALRAKGFNMKVIAFDKYWDKEFANSNDIIYSEINEILKKSDYISLHLPLTADTHKLIGSNEINMMKDTAYLINTSRGEIIDEQALYKALIRRKIAGAGLDVFSCEPPINSPFLSLDNIILTPHMGGFTDGALSSTSEFVAQIVIDALEGKELCSRIV